MLRFGYKGTEIWNSEPPGFKRPHSLSPAVTTSQATSQATSGYFTSRQVHKKDRKHVDLH